MNFFELILSALLTTVAVSLDALAAGFAYGTNNTHVPFLNILTINLICGLFLTISMFIGSVISKEISATFSQTAGISILLTLGVIKILQSIKKETKKTKPPLKQITWVETIFLAIALSLDGIAVGVGTAIGNIKLSLFLYIAVFSLITGMIFFILGDKTGKKITKKTSLNLSWLSGVILILIAFFKII